MSAQLDAIAQLQPDIARCVTAFLDAFPGSGLASGRRGIDDQARADADDEIASPGFIAATYVDSPVKSAMMVCVTAHPGADAAELATEFASVLGSFDDDALSHFSLHLSGHAADFSPVHVGDALVQDFAERLAWCEAWIPRADCDPLRSKVITHEGGLTRLHVQIVPKAV